MLTVLLFLDCIRPQCNVFHPLSIVVVLVWVLLCGKAMDTDQMKKTDCARGVHFGFRTHNLSRSIIYLPKKKKNLFSWRENFMKCITPKLDVKIRNVLKGPIIRDPLCTKKWRNI